MHHCKNCRCHRTSKGLHTHQCKYGFPFRLRDQDGYDDTGTRYEYKRTHPEDKVVVSYNPTFLITWDGHVNFQIIPTNGLEKYLVKYIAKVEPTLGLRVDFSSDVQRYYETRLISAPEAIAITLSYSMVNSDSHIEYYDTNMPSKRYRPMKDLRDLQYQDVDDVDIYKPGKLKKYERLPQSPQFDSMLYPDYVANYNICKHKPKTKTIPEDLDGNFVNKRPKPQVIRTHFTTALDGDGFYFQQLLTKVAFRSVSKLISSNNQSGTYKEECFLDGLFDAQDEFDVSFHNMKHRNVDPTQIAQIANHMLHAQLADRATIQQKIVELDYSEPIAFCDNELGEYQTVPLHQDIDADNSSHGIAKLLGVNKASILKDKDTLARKITSLTGCQQAVYNHVESNYPGSVHFGWRWCWQKLSVANTVPVL